MTNEELCILIKTGDDGLLPQLWEQVRKFVSYRAKTYYTNYYTCFGMPKGWEQDDLVQEGYFAVISAVSYYKPESGYKFLTLLNTTLKTAFATVTGNRTSKRDPSENSLSLDAPLASDSDAGFTLLDALRDLMPDDCDPSVPVVESIYNQQLRKSLDTAISYLDKNSRELLEMHYYFGMTTTEISDIKMCSKQNISQQITAALSELRYGEFGKQLYEFLHPACKNGDFEAFRACGSKEADFGIDPETSRLLA